LPAGLAGERDPMKLAVLSHPGIRATREEVAKSLEGHWQPELLFVLQQEVEMYDTYQQRIIECDRELERHLQSFSDKVSSRPPEVEQETGKRPGTTKRGKRAQGNAPRFDLQAELQRVSGVDLTRIDGIDVMAAQTLISEVGLDMSRWKTEGHFASWLGLCPDNRISGDRVLGKGTRRVAPQALSRSVKVVI
jgi:transposase